MSPEEAATWYRCIVAGLTVTEGEPACCHGRGDRELSRVHREAHLWLSTVVGTDPERRRMHRRWALGELRALTADLARAGRAGDA